MSTTTELPSSMSAKDKIKQQAKQEVQEERFEIVKEKLKEKYRQLQAAKKVVANIQRDIADYEMEIEDTETDVK